MKKMSDSEVLWRLIKDEHKWIGKIARREKKKYTELLDDGRECLQWSLCDRVLRELKTIKVSVQDGTWGRYYRDSDALFGWLELAGDAIQLVAIATEAHVKDAERGRKTLAAACAGHVARYGTKAQKEAHWQIVINAFDKLYADKPHLGKSRCYTLIAEQFGCSPVTVKRCDLIYRHRLEA